MNRSVLLILFSIVAVLISVGIVVSKSLPPAELNLLLTQGVVPESLIKRNRPRASSPAAGTLSEQLAEQSAAIERTDEELEELLQTLPILKSIPWSASEIAGMSGASSRSCRLLPPNSEISPPKTAFLENEGTMICQRDTAFLVGLKMEDRARRSLPSLSKATIENYLDSHLLAIQPEICRNRDGEFLLTGVVHAAFFNVGRSSLTEIPEPMIVDAVRGFRVLGVLPATEEQQQVHRLPRTVVMAFSYTRDNQQNITSLGNKAKEEYELIFLHLVPQAGNAKIPKLAVFTTTEGGKLLQELDINSPGSRSAATVMASIRFEKFELLGQYPSDPVVTGLSNKVRNSITMEQLQSRIQSREGESTAALQAILDEIHAGTDGSKVTSAERF